MKAITRHEPPKCVANRMYVLPTGRIGNEGAPVHYTVALRSSSVGPRSFELRFQDGHFSSGVNGITDESLLAIVEHRLQMRVAKNPNSDYASALGRVTDALDALHIRTIKHENPKLLEPPEETNG